MSVLPVSALQDDFRDAMSAVCTPVSVMTAMDAERPYGTTVSAFASLSLDPPMVLACMDRHSGLLEVLRRTGFFGLNVLSATQSDLATCFATKGGTNRFEGVSWERVGSVPCLPATSSFVACEVAELVDGGDHVVVLGRVVQVRHSDAAPLTYYRRTFGTHQPVL